MKIVSSFEEEVMDERKGSLHTSLEIRGAYVSCCSRIRIVSNKEAARYWPQLLGVYVQEASLATKYPAFRYEWCYRKLDFCLWIVDMLLLKYSCPNRSIYRVEKFTIGVLTPVLDGLGAGSRLSKRRCVQTLSRIGLFGIKSPHHGFTIKLCQCPVSQIFNGILSIGCQLSKSLF